MQKTVLVAGGGFSGAIAVMNLLRCALRAEPANRQTPLAIHWLDSHGIFARGLPYQEQEGGGEESFLLNIPAHMMSPFSDQSDLYTQWLGQHAPRYDQYSFTPRALYGRFLEDVLSELEAQVVGRRLGVMVIRHQAALIDLVPALSKLLATVTREQQLIECDAVALCVGHERVDQFEKFAHAQGYVVNPYRLSDYRTAIEGLDGEATALIIGGGSSSIDAVRACESAQFKGKYVIVTSSPVAPWGWDAELYKRRPPDQYEARYLTPQTAGACTSADELMLLLEREVAYALRHGFGYGSVYFGIKPHRLFAGTDSEAEPRRIFLQRFFQYRKAVSAPESVKLLEELSRSGRLVRLVGTATAAGSTCGRDGFRVALVRSQCAAIRGEILVNCAQVVREYRSPLRDGLLANLYSRKLVRFSAHGLLETTAGSKVFPFGPMVAPPEGGPRYLWSARYFRDEIGAGIQDLLAQLDAMPGQALVAGQVAGPLSMNSPTAPSVSH